jgi:hypothetical protein
MRPDLPIVLRGVAMTLFSQVAPIVPTPFGQQTAGIAGTLASIAGQEVDRLADRLLAENRAIVAVVDAAAPVVTVVALRSRIAVAPAELDTPDIRISTLQAANDRLRALLIDIHAAVELTPGEGARAMEERIWAELVESTRRRHVEVMR